MEGAIRGRAPEAHQLHGEQKPEHIGHVVMTAEPEPARPDEQVKPPAPTKQEVATLNRANLLTLSESIIIDGSSLRQIYETHLIGERGLRRLVNEHLSGGDLKKVLREEITEREIDFERDPVLRDMGTVGASSISTAAPAATGHAALDQLLERAAASVPAADINEETAFYKARANYEAEQHERHQRQRRLTDITLAATAAALITVAFIVYLTRH